MLHCSQCGSLSQPACTVLAGRLARVPCPDPLPTHADRPLAFPKHFTALCEVVEAARPAAAAAEEAELEALRTRQLAADTQYHAEVVLASGLVLRGWPVGRLPAGGQH